MADGDVPSGTGAGSGAGGDGDEAVWLDLVARFDAPAPADADPPWPDREDLAGPVHVRPAVPPGVPPTAPETAPREPPTNPTGLPGLPLHGGPPTMPDQPRPDQGLPGQAVPGQAVPGQAVPGQSVTGRAWPGLGGSGPRDVAPMDDPASEHYVPPVPPPLPRLDPATKLAWLALFGGPLYLLVATATSSPISGLAAFLAVAAFVGGFVVLVLRMDNGRPPDSGSDDDGAVV
ncbi:hypothetical protein EAS64_21875 [Trebonia kvetii]|uniref:DUF308 domain-containing protein n=1 Tax=Trebonia kvetii TaxID=2480626 RepID=A0A6P2BXW3_9ACTN|nr:hypothetical protein [Trebonia kvetii]TVZ03101.1 hypothetical protein EAS64_21875 [Trebonia kvetii]